MQNNGFIDGGKKTIIDVNELQNEKRLTQGTEQAVKIGTWGRHSKRNIEVDHLNPGGEIRGDQVFINAKKGFNKGGVVEGSENMKIVGGEFLNKPLHLRHVVHLNPGNPLPWKTKNAYSTRTEFMGALINSGGNLSVDLKNQFLNEASDVIAWNNLLIRAGEIIQRTLFSSYLSTSRRGPTFSKDLHTIEMYEGSTRSLQGNVKLISTKGNVEIEGNLGSYQGKVSVESAADILFLAKTESVENKVKTIKATPTTITSQITKSNTTETSLPTLFSGKDVDLKATQNIVADELQVNIGGDFDAEAKEIHMRQHVVEHYHEREGFSAGLEFFGSNAIEAAVTKKSAKLTVKALLEEDPAIKSLFNLAAARNGQEYAVQGITAAVHTWNEAAYLARAKNADNLKNAIGEHLGITDADGNFSPKVTIRLGVFNQEMRKTVVFAPQFFVGGNLRFKADKQRYSLLMEVGQDAEFLGKDIEWNAKVESTTQENSDTGFSVSAGPDGMGFGMDHSELRMSGKRHHHANLQVGGELTIQTDRLAVRGAKLEAEIVNVKAKSGQIESPTDTFNQTQWAASVSTSGNISFSYDNHHTKRVNQVSGLFARSHGNVEVDNLSLIGGTVRNIHLDAKHLQLQDVAEEDDHKSCSISLNVKEVAQVIKGNPSKGISILGTVEYTKEQQNGVTRALSGTQEKGRRKHLHVAAPILAFDTEKLKDDFNEMQKCINHNRKMTAQFVSSPLLVEPAPKKIEEETIPFSTNESTSEEVWNESPLFYETEIETDIENENSQFPRSTLDNMLTNWRKGEMRDAESAAALMDLSGDALIWGVKKVCSLHPVIHDGCRQGKQLGLKGLQWVQENIPTDWKLKIKQWMHQYEEISKTNASEDLRLFAIDPRESMRYYHSLNEVALNVALIPVGTVGGKAFGLVTKPILKTTILVKKSAHVLTAKVQQSRQIKKITDIVIQSMNNPTYDGLYSKISSLIPKFSAANDLASLHSFSDEVKKSRFFSLLTKDSRDILDPIVQGKSGGLIFMLQNSNGSYPLVTKLFPSSEHFATELISNKIYKNLELRHSLFPKIYFVGKQISEGGIEKGMVAMKGMPGESLGNLMQNAGKQASGSADRKKTLHTLHASFDRLATFLAELHGKNLHVQNKPAPSYLSSEIDKFHKRWNGVKEMELGVGEKDIEKLIKQFKNNPGLAGWVHGDVHPPNFFWDSKNLHSIDLRTLTRSMDKNGKPAGIPVKDYVQALASLEGYGVMFGLKAEEITNLKQTLARRYSSEFKGMHTPEAKRFYQYYWSFDRLMRISHDAKLLKKFQNQFKKELSVTSKAPIAQSFKGRPITEKDLGEVKNLKIFDAYLSINKKKTGTFYIKQLTGIGSRLDIPQLMIRIKSLAKEHGAEKLHIKLEFDNEKLLQVWSKKYKVIKIKHYKYRMKGATTKHTLEIPLDN